MGVPMLCSTVQFRPNRRDRLFRCRGKTRGGDLALVQQIQSRHVLQETPPGWAHQHDGSTGEEPRLAEGPEECQLRERSSLAGEDYIALTPAYQFTGPFEQSDLLDVMGQVRVDPAAHRGERPGG